jgi:hypothetical protein
VRRHAKRAQWPWFLLAGALSLSACGGKLDHPERFAATVKRLGQAGAKAADAGAAEPASDGGSAALPACVSKLLGKTCGVAGCHAVGSPQVDLASAGVAMRLVDVKSTSMMCKDKTYVSTTGGASLLLDKLGATPPCGARMPLGGMLAAADVQCLTDWVAALGGKPDAGAMP